MSLFACATSGVMRGEAMMGVRGTNGRKPALGLLGLPLRTNVLDEGMGPWETSSET